MTFLFSLIFILNTNVSAMSLRGFVNLSDSDAKKMIKQKAMKDYPDSYITIENVIKWNMDAFAKLKDLYPSMSNDEKRILEKALEDYDCAFITVLQVYEWNLQAKKRLEKD
jgi:hypothetical protein